MGSGGDTKYAYQIRQESVYRPKQNGKEKRREREGGEEGDERVVS